ncbi:MAG: FprA family A-type flavoprotein [Nitrososphaeria archaeon]|nr:FprA family A-type flavoprotein [Nitrososphaeria archaeon]
MPKTHLAQILGDVYLLRVDDEETRYFEALWEIGNKGITYNSYLLMSDDAVVLLDTWKKTYADEFLENLRELVDVRDVTHIILHHMEPDHSGSLRKVLEENGFRAEVLGHQLSKNMVRSFYGVNGKFRAVRDGERLSLGGLTLEFIHTPWLHWPETIMTYLGDRGVLFSGDAFGGFSIPSAIFDEDRIVPGYLTFVKEYISTVIGNYRQYITKNINKLMERNLDVKMIAPAHGLVWKNDPKAVIDFYLKVAEGFPEKGKVLVIYASMYGACDAAAGIVIRELERNRKKPIVYGFTDSERPPISGLMGDAADAESMVIITPTYESDVFPLISYITDMISRKIPGNKPILILSSYGWAGVAGKRLAERFEIAKFPVVDVVEFHGRPDEDSEKRIIESTRKLVSYV